MIAATSGLQERLLAHLEQLARPRHARWDPMGLMAVRTYLLDQLGAFGSVEEHRFSHGIDTGVNLLLRLPGQRSELEPILVGAHYDGPLHSIGADDNASGVAALLELAQRWAVRPPRRPVWLVAFDQEEWGMVGSGVLARELREAGLGGYGEMDGGMVGGEANAPGLSRKALAVAGAFYCSLLLKLRRQACKS